MRFVAGFEVVALVAGVLGDGGDVAGGRGRGRFGEGVDKGRHGDVRVW